MKLRNIVKQTNGKQKNDHYESGLMPFVYRILLFVDDRI